MLSIAQILEKFKDKKILVIGDIMLDVYTNGEVQRISPEAPVSVLRKNKDDYYRLGGGANVANNFSALGVQVFLAGIVGSDFFGKKILEMLSEVGIDYSGIISSSKYPTTVKHRFVATGQQLLRVDIEDTNDIPETEVEEFINKISKVIENVDGVMISDYAKGLFAPILVERLLELCRNNKKLVFADIKPGRHLLFKGVDYLSPNLKEAQEMTGENTYTNAAINLVKIFNADVFLTLGGEGILLADKKGNLKQIKARAVKVYDVTGAGDTIAAVAFASILSGADLETAAYLSNCAGEIVVQKSGTSVINKSELLSVLTNTQRHIDDVFIVKKVWGYEKWLENNDSYCSKILGLNKGFQCSLHYHKNKDEMFLVLKGKVRMEVGDSVSEMLPGSFVRIFQGVKHRFGGLDESEILEISTHHEESDSYRLEESRKMDS